MIHSVHTLAHSLVVSELIILIQKIMAQGAVQTDANYL